MKSILTLTDFSDTADHAVEAAFQLAQLYGADLHIYHDFTPDELIQVTLGPKIDIAIESANDNNIVDKLKYWNEWSQKLEVFTQVHFSSSDFIEEIENIIEKTKPDLIIMGSKGLTNKTDVIWGSNTQKVVKLIDCPILIIKGPMAEYELDNIIFASSFDEDEQKAFKYFLNLIKPPSNAIIHLVSVDTLGYFSQPTAAIKESMGKFAELAAPYETKSYFYKDYSVDAGLRHIMDELNPDMIVMTNVVNKPIKHFLQGNDVIKMVNYSQFPVLVIDY